MSRIKPLMPRRPVPDLDVETVGEGSWTLAERQPEHFTMVVFYRGLHCPICSKYLGDLERRLDEFAARGVDVIAISSDDAERAARTKQDWGLEKLTLGYGLAFDRARSWGLYISSGISKDGDGVGEPDWFAEPGLFLVRPDGTLYAASVQTMPFARPSFADVLFAVEFVTGNDYPARGEAEHPARAA